MFVHYAVFAQAGKVFSEAQCASGGYTYYFFGDRQVVAVFEGSSITVSVGTWKSNGNKNSVDIMFEYTKSTKPAPDAKLNYPVNAEGSYDKYVAAYTKEDGKPKTLDISVEGETCAEYKPHCYMNADEVIEETLRNKGKRQYVFASNRIISESELQKYSAQELRIMRNEIYASYGYIFKDQNLKSYFQNRGFYGKLTAVDAFLTDTEKKNINTIKQVEKQKGGN